MLNIFSTNRYTVVPLVTCHLLLKQCTWTNENLSLNMLKYCRSVFSPSTESKNIFLLRLSPCRRLNDLRLLFEIFTSPPCIFQEKDLKIFWVFHLNDLAGSFFEHLCHGAHLYRQVLCRMHNTAVIYCLLNVFVRSFC